MGRYIPDVALKNLDKYTYKGVDKSILSKYILNPYWNQLVKLWPTSVAPNTITLTGLSLVFINFLSMLYYDPYYLSWESSRNSVEPPRWLYLSWAIGLFLYQSLDAIDGKQARRTRMAGPLGELFDHGCDAINTSLESILASSALHLSSPISSFGRGRWWTLASLGTSLAAFYLTTWEEFHTHQLYLGVFSGPVEGILLIVGVYVLSGLYGPQIWDTNLFSLLHLDSFTSFHLGLNESFMVFGAFGLAFNIFTSYNNVSRSSSKSTLLPLLRLLPFLVSAALHVAWLASPLPSTSSHSVVEKSTSANITGPILLNTPLFLPFALGWGLTFAHHVGRIILAHLTRTTSFPLPSSLPFLILTLGAIDLNLPLLYASQDPAASPVFLSSQTRITLAVYTYFLIAFAMYARFCVLVIWDITEYMGIACFTTKKRAADGVWKSSLEGEAVKSQ